jgi:uncharacterized damage-inducible protein DinB
MMKEQLLKTLETSRAYTLRVAESMPEDSYAYKPVGASWTYHKLIHHIAYGIEWWTSNCVLGKELAWNPGTIPSSKKDITTLLNNAYDNLRTAIDESSPTAQEIQGFHSAVDHITHHRGQAVLYLRCKGIDPPEYSY